MNQASVLLLSFGCVALLSSFGNSFQQNFKVRVLYLTTLIAVLITSCNDHSKTSENSLPSSDTTAFFPLQEYFISQIINVQQDASIIHLYASTNEQKDSIDINTEQFNKLAALFLENNITDPSVKKYYKSSVFHDLTTGSYTFNYTSVNASLPVQTVDVLLDTATQAVKRIFISRIRKRGDSTIFEKLSWKTNTSFSVNRIIQLPANKETTQQITVAWQHNN